MLKPDQSSRCLLDLMKTTMNLALLDHLEFNSPQPICDLNHIALPLGKPANGQNRALGVLNHFATTSSEDCFCKLSPGLGLRQADQLERLLFDILARFVNVPLEDTEREIEVALMRVCNTLGVQWAGLWRKSAQNPASLQLTHFCMPCFPVSSGPVKSAPTAVNEADSGAWIRTIPLGTQSQACFPWITAEVKRGKTILFFRTADLPVEAAQDKAELSRGGTHSGVFIPLRVMGEVLGAVNFWMVTERTLWPEEQARRLEYVAAVFAQAIARKLSDEAALQAYAEIKELKDRLGSEANYLKSETEISSVHNGIIGRSQQIRQVLHKVEQVAPADCPVLISGETGTGKELIAEQIHRLSARKERMMVLVNCAALPTALVESELFGRERGAYTGALTSQVGRFEVANGSTIFLDEVGELPTEVQAKLLRVLQQGEFQRLGSPKTHKVDVRVIAATNRDLAEEVRRGRFREDLYYRLKVFPIDIPPLRERVEDIPLLVFAFMEELSSRMGKKITKVSRKAMEMLQGHSWPGNIRELRNVIEHGVILCSGDTLKLTVLGEAPTREAQSGTLAEAERKHILKTLESTSWRIKGPRGAAARLDLQPSTLYSRMQKLGIPHRHQKDEALEIRS
jgi:transcriptional regulator with GAF, ATPase, and Fis domain